MGNKEAKLDTVELISPEVSTSNDQEDVCIICLDFQFHEIKNSLFKISSYVYFVYSEQECLDFIKTIGIEKIFLIISSAETEIRQDLLFELNSNDIIDSIFIYSNSSNETITHSATKIIGIYTCELDLIRSIQKMIRLYERQQAAFSLYNQQEKNTRDLTQESGSFLFFQLFKEVLLTMQQTSESKQEMIDECKDYFRRNTTELKNIELFTRTYKSTEAIQWYTKNSFAYRLVNKALRTEDIEALYTFRLFIVDICISLHLQYNVLKKQERNLKLYRGVKLSTEEIQRLNDNVGKLMVHNGFLSCSRLRSIALDFAKRSTNRDVQSVLFEIDFNLNNANKIVAADIAELSEFSEEQEVLFDLGASFKIESCSYDSLNHLWLIKTTATNEGVELASDYLAYHKKKIVHSDIVLMFGHLLADMGQNIKSEKYFQSILRKCPNDEEIACIYHNMGRVYRLKEEYNRALDSYRRSYEMHLSAQPQRLISMANSLNGMGIVYNELHKYDLAIEYLTRALKIYEESLSKYHSEIASSLNNLANVYRTQGDYDRALEHLKRAKTINDRTLPVTHPNHATILNNIGNVYYEKNDYTQALNCYIEALKIREKVLPSDHMDLVRTYDNIGVVYYTMKEYNRAVEHFKKAQEISEKTLAKENVLALQIKTRLDLASKKC